MKKVGILSLLLLPVSLALSVQLVSAGKTAALPLRSGMLFLRDTLPRKDTPAREKIFTKVEVDAFFPGGEDSWRQFITQNIDPLVPGKNNAPAGTYTVIVEFVVDKEGKLINLQPLTHFGYGMEQEVIRLIKKSPRWKPAIQGGKPVNAYRRQPVVFVVTDMEKTNKNKDNL